MIAALFVIKDGPYFGIPGVDPWDESRDARRYWGSHPVVAHPPCERWGRYWSGGPSARVRREMGDDNGCFRAALDAVRAFGGEFMTLPRILLFLLALFLSVCVPVQMDWQMEFKQMMAVSK